MKNEIIVNKVKSLGPPLPPPNRTIKFGIWGKRETKESKKETQDYFEYLKRYEEKREKIKK